MRGGTQHALMTSDFPAQIIFQSCRAVNLQFLLLVTYKNVNLLFRELHHCMRSIYGDQVNTSEHTQFIKNISTHRKIVEHLLLT